jgi:hypothetical protein
MPEARDFFDIVFGEIDNASIYLFTFPDKRAFYYPATDDGFKAAEVTVDTIQSDKDVYVGVGLCDPANVGGKRPRSADIIAVPGLWADIDVVSEGKKGDGLPDSREVAVDLIVRSGIPAPSLLVNSGHGLQGWWLFKEPLWLPDEASRAKTERMVAGFQSVLRSVIGSLDSTHDLARILRVPGSTNHKNNEHCPVDQYSECDIRYSPDDFDAFLSDDGAITQPSVDTSGVKITFDPSIEFPARKISAMVANNDTFAATWGEKRDKAWTPSEYDQSIATYCAKAGFSDDEIVATIGYHRQMHGHDPKFREDYLKRTIAKGRKFAQKETATDFISDYDDTRSDDAEVAGPREDQRQEIIDSLKLTLGIPITGVVKYLSDPPSYKLETERGEVLIGEIANLISQNIMRGVIASVANRVIPGMKPREWSAVAQMLIDIRREEEIGEESTDHGRAWGWIKAFIYDRRLGRSRGEEGVLERRMPFIEDGLLYVFGGEVRLFLSRVRSERVSERDFGRLMRGIGFEPRQIRITSKRGRSNTVSIWVGDPTGQINIEPPESEDSDVVV